jgi:hypothetical protein
MVLLDYNRNIGGGIMAHFAKIENSIVREVIVVGNDDCGGGDFPASEPVGQAFLASLGLTGEWKQTSYSGSFRGRYAGIGYTFDTELNEFVAPVIPE